MMANNDSEFEPSLTFSVGHVESDESLIAFVMVVRETKKTS